MEVCPVKAISTIPGIHSDVKAVKEKEEAANDY